MKQRDPKWYTWNTILRLVQAYGRSVRSKDDFANTYILDGSISYLLRDANEMLPKMVFRCDNSKIIIIYITYHNGIIR